MERDNIPLELLWEETCESTLAVIGQLAITGQRAHPEGLKVKSQVQVGYTDISEPVPRDFRIAGHMRTTLRNILIVKSSRADA